MKGFFVILFATTFVLVTLADLKPIWKVPPWKIIRGTPATLGQFPYHVHMKIYIRKVLLGFCGGSIIHVNWVLTAAHCVDMVIPEDNLVLCIRAGTLTDSGPAEQTVLADGIYPYPTYNPDNLLNDIALLRTQTPFVITCNVAPISLIAPNTNPAIYVGQYVTVSGFGYTTNTGPVSNVLLYTNSLRGISFEDCQAQHCPWIMPTTSFCTQDTTPPITAVCHGDSGGPVTLLICGQRRLIGVVSYGSDEACDKFAQGHTNVAQFVPWIRRITGLSL